MSMTIIADGSALADARPRVEIDRSDPADRYRYACPRGHVSWDRTNSHIWCTQCARVGDQDDDVDPEHYELLDKKTGELIDWSRVELVGE